MQQTLKRFSFCPSCGAPAPTWDGSKRYNCERCSWQYYQNTASAAVGLLEYEGKILFTIRNQEPGKGLLDLPGGFTDPGESVEEALRREVKEELGMEIGELQYLGSFPNVYPYKGTEYTTCDIVFLTNITQMPVNIEDEEIAGILLLDAEEVNLSDIPFESIRNAVSTYINYKRRSI